MKTILIHLKLLFVAISWGLAWAVGRLVALNMPPATGAWLRYVIVVPLFLLWLYFTQGVHKPSRRQWVVLIAIGFFSTLCYQMFFMYGMRYTAAGDASLVITLNPLFTALLATLFLSRSLTMRLGLGLVLGMAGITVLFVASPNNHLSVDERMIGNTLIALAALSWAVSTTLMKKEMDEHTCTKTSGSKHTDEQPLTLHPQEATAKLSNDLGRVNEKALTPLAIMTWGSAMGLVFLSPIVGFEVIQGGIPTLSLSVMMSILFLAVVSTVIAYAWFAEGVESIGSAQAASYVYLVPPFGVLGGWLLLDEMFGWSLLFSFALIVGGVWLVQSEQDMGADGDR